MWPVLVDGGEGVGYSSALDQISFMTLRHHDHDQHLLLGCGTALLRSRSKAKSPDPAWWPGECRLPNVWSASWCILIQQSTIPKNNVWR
jgi:hypothetical protein